MMTATHPIIDATSTVFHQLKGRAWSTNTHIPTAMSTSAAMVRDSFLLADRLHEVMGRIQQLRKELLIDIQVLIRPDLFAHVTLIARSITYQPKV